MALHLSVRVNLVIALGLQCIAATCWNCAVVAVAAEPPQQSAAQESNRDPAEAPTVELGTIPDVKLRPAKPATKEEIAQIKRLIASLAEIANPDFGLSATLTGSAFLPVGGMEEFHAGLLTNHQLQSSEALRKLVELGPKSLPFLLDALDDKTPTKLEMKHEGFFGAMWFDHEMWSNPLNEREKKTLKKSRAEPLGLREDTIESYTVKVGDVCFVAIGQIVGRDYQAVRYQPTACIVINSPTHDPVLRDAVIKIWSSDDARKTLFDSLLLDYSTKGIFNGESLDGWSVGAELQSSAALRLLYYFPRETAPMIAERLRKLDVKATGPGSGSLHTRDELDAFMKQAVRNGVTADDFISAVAWCREPEIRSALAEVFKRATDPDVVSATLTSVGPDQPELVLGRLSKMLDALPAEEGGPFGDGYNLLIGLGKYGGIEAKPIFKKYLNSGTVERSRTMCRVLREVCGEWGIELLAPLLLDKRDTGSTYAVDPGRNEPQLPIRICDEAAETICTGHREIVFSLQGDHKSLDQQIDKIRQWIAKQRKKEVF